MTDPSRDRDGGALRPLDIAIIGAGFSGLGLAVKLLDAGIDTFTIYDRGPSVGGTWRDNTYPGCACDIPSHLYSFSFALNPDWSRDYPLQPEIERYLQQVADDHGLGPHLRFGTEITEARFDEEARRWTLHTTSGEAHGADVLVNATGPLSKPSVPELPGLDDFAGTAFHSARWDHDHDLTGERVAVIGTGAGAIQFVPEIAPRAAHVTVFQRTPPWVLPRADGAFSAARRRWFARLPGLARLHRWRIYARQELLALAMLGNRRVSDQIRRLATGSIAAAIEDPELRAAVTPDYEPGCKRLLISNDWYPTLARPDVTLETSGIAEIRPHSIVTIDGVEHEVDTIVLGTGFRATEFIAPMKVFGRNGVELSDAWQQGAVTHLGLVAPGFPNLFLLVGPSTTLGHNSVVFMIEAQIRYVLGALAHLRATDAAVEIRPDVADASYAEVQRRMARTVWSSGCHSWYQSADGHIDTLWPGFTVDYWWRTRRFDPSCYRPVPARRPAAS